MARIPSADDLGPRPVQQIRSPRIVDQSGEIAAESMGRAAERIGQAVTAFGERRDLFNASKAKAAYLTAEAATRAELENDPDWETYETRYREKMTKTRDQVLKGVKTPGLRESVGLEFDSALERGAATVRGAARVREVDSGRAELGALMDGARQTGLLLQDEQSRAALIQAVGENILTAQANGYISEVDAQRMRQRWTQDYAEGLVGTKTWAEQVDMLKGKGIVDHIAPDRRADLLRQAENQVRIERERAEAERKSSMVELRQSLNDGQRDMITASQLGLPVTPTPKKVLQSAFGEAEGAARYELQVKASQLSADVASLQQLPTSEIMERVASYKPTKQEGAAEQGQLYGYLANSAQNIIEARAKDPAGYLVQFAPKSQSAWAAFQQDGSQANRDAYFAAIEADRERLGLAKGDILPNSYAKALAEEIANPASAEKLADLMETEAQRWGTRWGDVHAQIARDLPDMAAVIGSGIDRSAAVNLSSTAKLKESELKAMLPPSVKWADVQDSVKTTFDEVRRSFPAEGARTYQAIEESAVRLAVSYMQAGASQSSAIERAYKELISNQYTIGEVKDVTFLIPHAVSGRPLDSGKVQEQAERIIEEFEPTPNMIAAPAGDDPARFIERAREKFREEAYWVARGDGTGLRLHLGGRPTGVSYTFEQLQEMATAREIQEANESERRRQEDVQRRAIMTSPGLR